MAAQKKEWFIHVNNSPEGPFTENEIWGKLRHNIITYKTYIWKKGYKNWMRLENESIFDQMPPDTNPNLQETPEESPPTMFIKPNETTETEMKIWYINENKERTGPFTESEVVSKIQKRVIGDTAFVWRKGFNEWTAASRTAEFKEHYDNLAKSNKKGPKVQNYMDEQPPLAEPVSPKKASHTGEEKRKHQRAPLLARIIAHDNQDIAYMPCGNISEGGIFLHAETKLWEQGTKLKLNIKSDSFDEAFNVQGVVIGFSSNPPKGYNIKFEELEEKYRKVIQSYVKTKA